MKRATVLLVDDHALLRSGVAAILRAQADFEVVGESGDGADALVKARRLRPDIVLMDLYMPGPSGIETTRRIREVLPDTQVVMLTFSEEDKDLFAAVKAGAYGYILKRADLETFLETLRKVHRREAVLSRATAGMILGEWMAAAADGPSTGETAAPDRLTPREYEVLQSVSRGASNKEIAAALAISENTVKNHLKRILEKLHVENRVQAATYAIHHRMARGDT